MTRSVPEIRRDLHEKHRERHRAQRAVATARDRLAEARRDGASATRLAALECDVLRAKRERHLLELEARALERELAGDWQAPAWRADVQAPG
jgi:hypothetical protein